MPNSILRIPNTNPPQPITETVKIEIQFDINNYINIHDENIIGLIQEFYNNIDIAEDSNTELLRTILTNIKCEIWRK